jgi:AcrR family transcriptional regulator
MSTAARRQQIIDTARTVFATRGFRGATTREIAAAAGVTEAVIFQHFADKQALYDAILEQKAHQLGDERWFEALAEARRAGDDEVTLRVLFAGLVDQHRRDPAFLRLMVYASLEAHPVAPKLHARGRRLYDFVEAFIRDGQRRRKFRAGPVPLLVRAVLALPIYHILQRQLFQTPWPRVAHEDVIDEGVRFALAGLTDLSAERAS